MKTDYSFLNWVFLASCLALSFLLSGMEAGLFALSRLRIRRLVRAGRGSAKLLHGFLENPENFLWTILVGNTLANFFILGAILLALDNWFHRQPFVFLAVFCAVVFLFYTFFDLLPKMLFRAYPNRLCITMARPFRMIYLVLRPLVWLVEAVSAALLRWTGGTALTGRLFGNREELRFLMQESAHGFTSEERGMINRVLDLQSMTVRLITKPLDLAVTVDVTMPVSEVLARGRESRATRLPVCERRAGERRIVGLVNINALLFQENLAAEKPVAEFMRPALYLDEDTRLEVALRRMQRSGQRLAVVLGRDQREVGILSLQDILELLFGKFSL
ncbi:MAG: CNNM domain-containing protein [Verrucomicrobiota bacterium]